jgi:sulfur carrier protein ThiS
MSLKIEVDASPAFQPGLPPSRFTVTMEETEASATGLLHRLAGTGGEKTKDLLFEKGSESILSGLMVMINDRIYTGTALNGRAVPLHDGDRVSLLYFVSGG